MRFFAQGRLGHTVLNMSLSGLWTLVKFCPPHDPWLKGESFTEIIKRIASLEHREFADVQSEVTAIRQQID
jgi:hypothetical protein